MNKDVALKWAEALESGEYQQGNGGLCKLTDAGPRFCCLGVLCELAIKDGVKLDLSDSTVKYRRYNGDGAALPSAVMRWAGLYSANPIIGKNSTESAAWLNDIEQVSFVEIAQAIRKMAGIE